VSIDFYLSRAQQIEEHRSEALIIQVVRDKTIARTLTAAAAAVNEHDQTGSCFRQCQRALQGDCIRLDPYFGLVITSHAPASARIVVRGVATQKH
jgi:hypothetical protein